MSLGNEGSNPSLLNIKDYGVKVAQEPPKLLD